MQHQPLSQVWNERWRLARLSRQDILVALLGAGFVGLLATLFHLQGVSTDPQMHGNSSWLWMISRWKVSGPAIGSSVDHSHGWLIPVIAAAVVWWRRTELQNASKSTSGMGLAVLVLGLLLHWFGVKAQIPRVSLFALILILWGTPFYLFGWQVARLLIFPCAYLVFCIPLNFLDSITLPLRVYMTSATHFILTGLGLLIVQSGTALHSVFTLDTPYLLHPDNIRYSLEIADPCSGIRSLIAMVAITAIYAFVTMPTLTKKWVLFLCAVPLAVAGNTLRILTIAMVSEGFGQKVGAGLYHDFAGYLIFLAFTIPLMILTGNLIDSDLKSTWRKWKRKLLSPT